MKVQRKLGPKETYEVLNESPTHYIIDRGCNDIALRKADYEPVPEWVDVFTCPVIYGDYRVQVHQDGRVHVQGRLA